MKKTLTIVLAAILLLTLLPMSVFAADPVTVKLDDADVSFPDAKPFVNADDRTLTPLSPIATAMGLKVTWYEEEESASFTRSFTPETSPIVVKDGDAVFFMGSETVSFTIGSKEAAYVTHFFNADDKEMTAPMDNMGVSKTIAMDTTAVLQNQRTYAPVKYLAETLGYMVGWDEYTNTVILHSTTGMLNIAYESILGNGGDYYALGIYKGRFAEMAGLNKIEIKSVTVDGKNAVFERFTEEQLDNDELTLDDYLDGGYIRYDFKGKTDSSIYQIAVTYETSYEGKAPNTEVSTFEYDASSGFGGIM
ncbi:copper amine oxidase N-terminal domain-containing protein [Bacilliculturomica massiliensis]|uniref:copper amine oxidase N-terminal domain-containing protein n=1 Tax=Bacilliculturomica massiliensis TaxID=1917867 RepID=UPI00102FE57A|nr:copper amine oxidase N-terminal domain-containing protein [Bacilliculturomica massiliensis]